jgi:DNA-binding GntR family transcriptional regulator
MPLDSRKLVQATLRQQIVKEIRQAIINRTLLPGERLVERTLAERLGTSLTAIREALIQLETEGLITKKTNATTHVTKLTLDEVEQIYAVRRVLERYAFEEAARVADQSSISRLKELYKESLQIAKAGDDIAYISADLRWHEAVWEATKNYCLVETLRRVVVPLFGFSAITTHHGFNLKQDVQTHTPLLNAIVAHDSVAAGVAFDKFSEVWHRQFESESTVVQRGIVKRRLSRGT